jgi:O-antigen/teichoic acid export membrane protein
MNGISALRRSIDKLTYLTAIYILPIIALSVVLAEQIIVFLFHEPYLPAVVPFQVLMIATIVTAIDQILSQALVAMGRYRSDLISVVGGAASILIATSFLSVSHGALGAALAFLLSLTLTVIIRLFLIRSVLRLTNYWTLMSRQLFSASIAGIIIWIAKYLVPESVGTTNQYGWLLLLTLGVFINFGTLYLLGGISMAKRRWLLRFLRRRN